MLLRPRVGRRVVRWLSAASVALSLVAAGTALAAEPTPLWREVSAGIDATPHTWLAYSTTTIAPASDLWSDGLRFRFAGGYGKYHYDASRYVGAAKAPRIISYTGQTHDLDGLAGYLWRLGPLTAKLFAGASLIAHNIGPTEDPLASTGTRIGGKGVLEMWLNIGETAWSSLDASFSSAHATYAVRTRVGCRVLPTISLGIEAAITGNGGRNYGDDIAKTPINAGIFDPQHFDARLGGLARYEWFGGEFSLAGGLSTDFGVTSADKYEPYVTSTLIYQF